ncbi:hypothetical protein WMY93_006107 [Mugilogobius chulae]|uniref:Rab11-FIP3/4 domain-containing protein n=1 Tax=Mugilogobius chulae TaxID=88201 RepID=A0AAW0PLG0_9GOBI
MAAEPDHPPPHGRFFKPGTTHHTSAARARDGGPAARPGAAAAGAPQAQGGVRHVRSGCRRLHSGGALDQSRSAVRPRRRDQEADQLPGSQRSRRINFKDFCHGVFAIKGCEDILKMPVTARSRTSSQASVTDNGYIYQNGEARLGPPNIVCSSEPTRQRRGGQTPQKMHQLCNSELLDIYCSQCCKKVNLLNDLEARLRNLKSNSPRKISSRAFGRQLIQANHSVFGSSPHSSTEDLFTDSIDSCDLDIADKVSYLEKKVTELEGDCLANGDLKSKLKQENTHLVLRVHELEEQLCSRIQELEEENGDMKLNVRKLRSQTEKLDQEKQKMSDKLEDTNMRLKDEMELYRKIMDKLWQKPQ